MCVVSQRRCGASVVRVVLVAVLSGLGVGPLARAATMHFFDDSQAAALVASGVTSDTISCNGYQFTYTRDKLFTGGIGPDPIGRSVGVPWPAGVTAQAVTVTPPGVTDHKARLVVERADGGVFDLRAFTAKLLANTAGAGADIEIMPQLDGEDGFNDPLYFAASGYYGQSFSYDTTPNVWGSTALLTGFDKYTVTLYVDFAFTALTLNNSAPPLAGDFDGNGAVNGRDLLIWQRGASPGGASAASLALWQAHYGATAPVTSIAAAVPEPSTILLLLALAPPLALSRKFCRASSPVGDGDFAI